MKVYKNVYKACVVAEKLARSRNEVMVVVPVHGKLVREALVMTVNEWIDLRQEKNFPVDFHTVFDKNGVKCSTTLFKDAV